MSIIKVTAGDLTQVAGQVTAAANTIQETSTQTMQLVVSLTNEGWQGGGSAAAQAAIQQWNQGATQIQEALATISNLIGQAESSYTETDSSVASSFAR